MTEILPTLYKRDTKGKIREWFIEIEGDKYRTVSGLSDGQKVTAPWTTALPKNLGRSNETSGEAQALLEAEAEYTKKQKQKYHLELNQVDNKSFFAPTLAEKYKDHIKHIFSHDVLYSQPKLDGFRGVSHSNGLWTRKGEIFYSVPHIVEAMSEIHGRYNYVIDGELYNHVLHNRLNEISSLVRKQKDITPDQFEESRKIIQYHCYDMFDPNRPELTFGQRSEILHELLDKYTPSDMVVAVSTSKVDEDHENVLDILYGDYIENNYEGQMIRMDVPYVNKRTKNLIKRKTFMEEEFPVVGVEEGKGTWSGKAKSIRCLAPNGKDFGASLKGDMEYAAKVLREADKYIGKGTATVRFIKYTAFGVPFHGIVELLHGEDGRI